MRDIYIAIMRAAARGEGVRLSADECGQLSIDDAIATRAGNALEAGENVEGFDWGKCDPSKPRRPANRAGGADDETLRFYGYKLPDDDYCGQCCGPCLRRPRHGESWA